MWMPLERALTSLLRMAVRANLSFETLEECRHPAGQEHGGERQPVQRLRLPAEDEPGQDEAFGSAGEISPVVDDHAENLCQGERRDGEIHGPETQDDEAQERCHEGREDAREQDRKDRGDAELQRREGRRIGADAEEPGNAE